MLDAHALGIDLDEGSRTQSTASRNRFCKAVNEKAAHFLEAETQPSLAMLFGAVPDFDTILADLAALEAEIHALA